MTNRSQIVSDLATLILESVMDRVAIVEPTRYAPALANGAEGKASVHCRRSLDEQNGRTRPRAEQEVRAAQAKKAPARRISGGDRLVLKTNKEVRGLLTKAAAAAGGTRLSPIGFASYTDFLAGVPLENGAAVVVFVPVKGNSPVAGKNVKLTISGGKVIKVA